MNYSTKDIPKIKSFKALNFPEYSKYELSNSAPTYILGSEDYDVLKIEMNFKAGRVFEKGYGVARACADQMKEGTQNLSSEIIAETIDFYGATMHISGGMDFTRVELYSTKKHLKNLLPLLRDVLHNPSFPELELEGYIKRNIQRLTIDLSKNDILSYRTLTEKIFGVDHPYGYNSTISTIEHLNRNMLLEHFENNFLLPDFSLILAGGIDPQIIDLCDNFLGDLKYQKRNNDPFSAPPILNPELFKIEAPQKFQSSIRMGRHLFDRSHPDYPGVYVLNTILGGFFGSRLMSNIREEKGLTYDIYSTIDMLWLDGYIMIGADVDNENVDVTIEEIFKEFEILKKDLVKEKELELVRNYINGNLLNLMNGPFNSIELMRLIAVHGQNHEFFSFFMGRIASVDAPTLRDLARKYLNENEFTVVIVGN